jgi:hypothetical protein
MAFLTLAGIDVRVVEGTAVRHEDLVQGELVRAATGGAISTLDSTTAKVLADCQIDLYSEVEENAIRAACVPGTPVAITGDWLPSISAHVTLQDASEWSGNIGVGDEVYTTLAVHIEEA